MSIQQPCFLSHGEKLQYADCYVELYLFPGGYFQMKLNVRAGDRFAGTNVSAGFALFDAQGAPIVRSLFGMDEKDAVGLPPVARGFPPERTDTFCGVIPGDLMARAERVAVCIRPFGSPPDWQALQKRASEPKQVLLP